MILRLLLWSESIPKRPQKSLSIERTLLQFFVAPASRRRFCVLQNLKKTTGGTPAPQNTRLLRLCCLNKERLPDRSLLFRLAMT
jgi:hypothetical protein